MPVSFTYSRVVFSRFVTQYKIAGYSENCLRVESLSIPGSSSDVLSSVGRRKLYEEWEIFPTSAAVT